MNKKKPVHCKRCGIQIFDSVRESKGIQYCRPCVKIVRKGIVRVPKDPRICLHCGQSYAPTGGKQKWCSECSPGGNSSLLVWYNMTQKDKDELFAKQGGKCALCPAPAEEIDHSHVTGMIRGALCSGCNTALCNKFEDEEWLTRAIAYVRNTISPVPHGRGTRNIISLPELGTRDLP